MNITASKNKHLTLEERTEIQECLYKCMTFKAIAKLIGKDPTTVSKEVKLHAQAHRNSFVKTEADCPRLMKAPFVCNGCRQKSSASCSCLRRVYMAKTAQEEYEKTLVESREGIALNKASFYENDRIISERVIAGQHIYHIVKSSDISVSQSTVYRYFRKGYLSASVVKLPRAVKFKERNSKPSEYVPKGVKADRTYEDFVRFTEENDIAGHVELDTVIGNPGGKVIMTVIFTDSDFMFGFLLNNKTAAEASSKIISFKKKLAENSVKFSDVFSVILTDNGGEFSDVSSFENGLDGTPESKLFFCDPMHSSQKPFVEKNHTLLRDIVPKGTSFDAFTQDTVDLIFSHINSVKRKNYNGKSSYDLFSFIYSEEFASILNIRRIDSDKVIQSTKLQKSEEFIRTLRH